MIYRPEIDGLRAIAVLGVIFYHCGSPLASGGFFGVDIFFVISGYLITSILMTNVATGRMSLSEFYARRVRRIAPAFFMVMFCTSVAAWFLLPTHQMLDYGRSLAAASLLVSNVLFWRGSGYFDLEAELRPLLHTWSLGVEEQFYIFYPLLLLWALKRIRKGAIAMLNADRCATRQKADSRITRLPLILATLLAMCSGTVYADAVFERTTGEVRFSAEKAKPVNAADGVRVTSGSTVSTGASGRTILRFDDGQAVVLNPNTEFKITNYRFDEANPKQDSAVFELLKGAMRSVSGLIGRRNAQAYVLRSSTATIGIRGTDFMVALDESTKLGGRPLIFAQSSPIQSDAASFLGEVETTDIRSFTQLAQIGPVNPMYFQVAAGNIGVTTGAGTVGFGAGAIGTVAGPGALAASISAASLPAGIAGSFSSLSSVAVSAGAGAAGGASGAAGGGAAGATGAVAGATGGIGLTAIGIGAAVVGAVAAAASNNENQTGTTGTR